MPGWVSDGVNEYAQRLPHPLRILEIPVPKRGKTAGAATVAMAAEADKILAAIPTRAWVIALDEHGQPWTTRELSRECQAWLNQGRDVALLIGGPDGLAAACKTRADALWSLSNLTLPHGLARIVVVEQLYRAFSLLAGHPYHRD